MVNPAQHGYECEFVKSPPDAIQTECPICLNILRDPQQAKCCGKCFCSSCLEKLVKKECPACKKQLSTFEDKRHRQSLEQLHVYCSHRHHGCQWTGELGELDRHLNRTPAKGKEQEGCQFAEVQCIHCKKVFKRTVVKSHPFSKCPKRRVHCKNHKKGCDWLGELGDAEQHVTVDCPMVEVVCEFKDVGCDEPLLRRDVDVHRTSNVNKHMLLLLERSRTQAEENATNISGLENKLDQIRRGITVLDGDLQAANSKIRFLEETLEKSKQQQIAQSTSNAARIKALEKKSMLEKTALDKDLTATKSRIQTLEKKVQLSSMSQHSVAVLKNESKKVEAENVLNKEKIWILNNKLAQTQGEQAALDTDLQVAKDRIKLLESNVQRNASTLTINLVLVVIFAFVLGIAMSIVEKLSPK